MHIISQQGSGSCILYLLSASRQTLTHFYLESCGFTERSEVGIIYIYIHIINVRAVLSYQLRLGYQFLSINCSVQSRYQLINGN